MARMTTADDAIGKKKNPAKKKRKARRAAPRKARTNAAAPRKGNPRPKKAPARRAINPSRRKVCAVATTRAGRAADVNLFHLVATDPGITGGAGRSWRLPAAIVKSKDFQAWAYGMNYTISATRAQLVAKLRRFV